MTSEDFEKFDSSLPPVQADALIRHMELYYSDRNIVEDLDSVLACCRTKRDRELVQNYADARRKSPGFNARDYAHNNHKQIDPELLDMRATTNERPEEVCQGGCGIPFTPKSKKQIFCSPECRKQPVWQ